MKNYELWALGYTADEECTAFEVLIAEFPYNKQGKEDGLKMLRTITAEDVRKLQAIPDEVKLLELALEEVKDFSKDERSAFEITGTRWIEAA